MKGRADLADSAGRQHDKPEGLVQKLAAEIACWLEEDIKTYRETRKAATA